MRPHGRQRPAGGPVDAPRGRPRSSPRRWYRPRRRARPASIPKWRRRRRCASKPSAPVRRQSWRNPGGRTQSLVRSVRALRRRGPRSRPSRRTVESKGSGRPRLPPRSRGHILEPHRTHHRPPSTAAGAHGLLQQSLLAFAVSGRTDERRCARSSRARRTPSAVNRSSTGVSAMTSRLGSVVAQTAAAVSSPRTNEYVLTPPACLSNRSLSGCEISP
jgi:hypothetical protein